MASNPYFIPYEFHTSVLALGITMPIVCMLLMGLRMYVRRYQKGGLGADDWLAFATLPFIIGMGACLIAGVKLGAFGYPTPPPPTDITPAESLTYESLNTKQIEQLEFAFQHILFFALALVKLSIMFFYRRLFVVDSQGYANIISIGIMVLIVAWFIAFQFAFLFICNAHVDATWGSFAQIESDCPNLGSFHVEQGMAFSDLFLDLIVFLFPFPAIWNLHLDPLRKLALSSVFMVGLMAIASSVIRLAYYEQALVHIDWVVEGLVDSNLATTTALYWSFLEAGLSLIAACLPSMSYFFTKRSMGSIVGSIRSAISLRSIRSQGSSGSKNRSKLADGTSLPYSKVGEHGSSTSQAGMVPQMVPDNGARSEAHATSDVPWNNTRHDEEDDAIYVKKDFSQMDSAV